MTQSSTTAERGVTNSTNAGLCVFLRRLEIAGVQVAAAGGHFKFPARYVRDPQTTISP